MADLAYKRVLLKLSGEALLGEGQYGIDPDVMSRLAREINEVCAAGAQVAVVVGGGNIFRGAGLAEAGMDRVTGDQMGMLATVINALAIQDAVERTGLEVRVMSAIRINQVCEEYIRRRAMQHLTNGHVVVFAAGTGNPFFTTDSAASLRAVEVGAELLLKATKVDGIYDKDPMKHEDATHYKQISFDEVLNKRLSVMDLTAILMCKDNDLPLRVFNMNNAGDLMKILKGDKDIGTLVTQE